MAAGVLAAYQALHETARRQLDALAADDLEAFEAATADRERAFAEVRAHEGELASLEDARLTEIRRVIDQILADDAKIKDLATAAAAQAQEELAKVQQGLNALQAYASEGSAQGYFIDQSS